jgi:hypothetical protein
MPFAAVAAEEEESGVFMAAEERRAFEKMKARSSVAGSNCHKRVFLGRSHKNYWPLFGAEMRHFEG